MKRSRRDPIRAGLGAALAALMLTLSVAIPVLEQGSFVHRPVAESHHDPGDCPSGHDHRICTQVGANLAIGTRRVAIPLAQTAIVLSPLTGTPAGASGTGHRANPSRAPPLA